MYDLDFVDTEASLGCNDAYELYVRGQLCGLELVIASLPFA